MGFKSANSLQPNFLEVKSSMQEHGSQLDALKNGCGFVELSLSLVRISGGDREKFLHNFCTADIKKLQPNHRCEAFFLNSKGKTISHGIVIKREIDLLIVSTSESASVLIENLDRYLLSEDVVIEDVSTLWRSVFVTGERTQDVFAAAEMTCPSEDMVIASGFEVATTADLAGQGVLLLEPLAGDVSSQEALGEQGATKCSLEAFHQLRIEKQIPWVDLEISDANLPQEFRRDEVAISFNKGCYLGQETVARLDAMGHVNQFFVGLEIVSGETKVGDELMKDGKKIGRITSMVQHPDFENPIALGFLRSAHAKSTEPVTAESCIVKVRS